MKEKLKILIIDDHPMIIEGYQKAISSQSQFTPNIISVNDCEETIAQLNKSKNQGAFDLVLVDIQIPSSRNMKFTSGEDIALYIGNHFKETKIIILTMINKATRLENMIKTIPHNGILIKSDVSKSILVQALFNVMDGGLFYSKSVSKIANRVIQNNDLLDEKNVKIIYHLSRGVKTNQIPEYISLSLSAVEKRKKYIKQFFDVENDEELLVEAKKRGFL
ncbi:Transcriptional regulatory protein ComA [Polaribacter huanghezhanensis]|uniref:response regulator n=1 Tax=Polaribacter huanghezhanensis TaxID=1354726 RepID=UPI002647C167|nr:response regulator [Polaribacter huanghezhanensis]WKD85244.1 Transcriptional regulatory protein ComA [Polaribacter huanghezhanensis]